MSKRSARDIRPPSTSRWLAAAILVLALSLIGCERYPTGGDVRIRRDMVDQPSFRPQEDPRTLPEGSIPSDGWEAPMTIEQAQRLANPVDATEASLRTGERLFKIVCATCHGPAGQGGGPVAEKIGSVANLTDQKYLDANDGFFYHVIRYGSGIMPAYSESLSVTERWHVINYVRKLQGR